MNRSALVRAASAAAALLLAGTLHADTLYWGGTATSGPVPTTTAGLTADWTNSTANWATNTAGTTYQAWTDGAVANLGYFTDAASATLSPTFSPTLSGLVANLSGTTGSSRTFSINPTSAQTLTLGGSSVRFLVQSTDNTRGVTLSGNNNLSLAGSATLVKDGNGILNFGTYSGSSNSNGFTGSVLVRSGIFSLNPSHTMNGVTDFTLRGYRPGVTGTSAGGNEGFSGAAFRVQINNFAANSVNDNAVVTLTRGEFDYRGGGASSSETIGKIVLQPFGVLSLSSGNVGTLTLGDATNGLVRGDPRGTMIVGVTSADLLKVTVKIPNTTLPLDTLLPWAPTSRGEFTKLDSSNGNAITRIASTNASLDASTWVGSYANADLRVNGVLTNSLTGSLTLNSFGFLGSGSDTTLSVGAGNTLTIASGGIANIGNNAKTHKIDGGDLTTTAATLYVTTGWSNTGSMTISSRLTGTYDLVKSGITKLELGGADSNTFVGDVYVNSGDLFINKTSGATGVNGNVYVRTGGSLNLGGSAALAATSNVTLDDEALLNVGSSNTIGGKLVVNGGHVLLPNTTLTLTGAGTGVEFNGGTWTHNSTGGGNTDLRTNLSYAATSTEQAVFQKFGTGTYFIRLNTGTNAGNAERVFDIADSTTLAADKPEMVIDAIVANGGSGSTTGSLRKTGSGVLMMTGANTYTGGTIVDGGELRLGTISAAAQSGLTATGGSSGGAANIVTFTEPITGTMAVGQSISGTTITSGRIIVGILNEYEVLTNGTNTAGVSTNIALGAVNRVGSLAGDVTVNNDAVLRIDAGSSVAGNVTLNGTSTLKGNGTVVGSTTINSGGFIKPGLSIGTLNTGALTLAGTYECEMNATSATADNINVTGSVSLGSLSVLNVSLVGTLTSGQTFTIIANDDTDAVSGTFNGLAENAIVLTSGSYYLKISYAGGSGNDVVLYTSPVPEPASLSLLALGAAALRRRRA